MELASRLAWVPARSCALGAGPPIPRCPPGALRLGVPLQMCQAAGCSRTNHSQPAPNDNHCMELSRAQTPPTRLCLLQAPHARPHAEPGSQQLADHSGPQPARAPGHKHSVGGAVGVGTGRGRGAVATGRGGRRREAAARGAARLHRPQGQACTQAASEAGEPKAATGGWSTRNISPPPHTHTEYPPEATPRTATMVRSAGGQATLGASPARPPRPACPPSGSSRWQLASIKYSPASPRTKEPLARRGLATQLAGMSPVVPAVTRAACSVDLPSPPA